MRVTSMLVVALALLSLPALPSFAEKLQPGTYKLEWNVPQNDELLPFGRRAMMMIGNDSEDAPRLTQLASERWVWGTDGKWFVVLDESAGTGKGYDLAYVTDTAKDNAPDLSKAVKVTLKKQDDGAQLGGSGSMNINIGEPGAQVVKQAMISLDVLFSEEAKEMPDFSIISIGGGWQGKVKTDAGEVEVRLFDLNGNNVYGDKLEISDGISSDSFPAPGDMIVLGDFSLDSWNYHRMIYLGEAVLYQGSLYTLDTSKIGDTITIAPYEGPIGTLIPKAVDGYGKPAVFELFGIYGKAGLFLLQGSSQYTLPAGNYACIAAEVTMNQPGVDPQKRFSVSLKGKDNLTVTSGKTTTVSYGGPMKVEIEPSKGVITARQGETLRINLYFTAGNCSVTNVFDERSATVNIRDAKGKLLISGKAPFG